MSRKGFQQNFIVIGAGLLGLYSAMRAIARRTIESKNIDAGNPYLSAGGENRAYDSRKYEDDFKENNLYVAVIKPALDKILSFCGLIILIPMFAGISLAIYFNDPGDIFFIQKRIGKDKHYVYIHKFRTMKMSAPHDVPTHQLKNPDQYITRVGKTLRKMSLDELPQIWDIFCGRMSIIGPRPALWNQNDLVLERDKYDANSVMPGLTGLAQVNGRDELTIPVKAKFDGEYVKVLRSGSFKALKQDIECLIKTLKNVASHRGVVEGGTGNAKSIIFTNRADVDDYGCHKRFNIDRKAYKKILITGKGSYIGRSLTEYIEKHYINIEVDTVDMIDGTWRKYDFSSYDAVFHVAGLAHVDVEKVSDEIKKKYYEVNTNLAIETARKARMSGVKQFVFMSSIIIYGDSAPYGTEKIIDEHTVPAPSNFYGDSKWQADQKLRELTTDNFHVAVLRCPMIYGKESGGNYSILSKLAGCLFFFPEINNKRSMLYIDNLCEFVSQLILSGKGGVYFPQNKEYSSTSELFRMIRETRGVKIYLIKGLSPVVKAAGKVPGKTFRLINKAFGNLAYDQQLSQYNGLDYQLISLKESINQTEKEA